MTNDEGVAAMGSNDTRDTVEVARITMPIDALAFAAVLRGIGSQFPRAHLAQHGAVRVPEADIAALYEDLEFGDGQ